MSGGRRDPAALGGRPDRRRVLLAILAGSLSLPLVAIAAAGREGPAPAFRTQVAPIVRAKCAGCHQDGGIAPFAFRTAGDLQQRKDLVRAVLRARLMPPWPPGGNSPAYVAEDRRTLAEAERRTLLDWLDAGARAPTTARVGDAPAPAARRAAGESLLTVSMPRPYLPKATGGGTDDYRCFLFDPGLRRDTFMRAARIEPGRPSLVHHVILFRARPGEVAAARKLDAAAAGPGWSCFGGTAIPASGSDPVSALDDAPWIAAWAPGWGSDHLPAGIGVPLPAGTQIVVQVHYNLLNGSAPDRSRAVLTTVPGSRRLKPLRTMLLPAPVEIPCVAGESAPLCDRDAAIADGMRKYGHDAGLLPFGLLYLCGKDPQSPPRGLTTSCDRRVASPTTIHGVAGHMHLLGASIKVELNPGTASARTLLEIPRWDFHWQTVYTLRRPVRAAPGDVVRVTCAYDTSRRPSLEAKQARTPRYIVWGEGTTDEMCLGVLQVTRP